MLKQRVLTAIVLVLIVLGALFSFSFSAFQIFLGFVISLAAWEWSALANYKAFWQRVLYVGVIALSLYLGRNFTASQLNWILMLDLCLWLLIFVSICAYPKFSKLWENKSLVSLIGFFVLFPCWLSLLFLRGEMAYVFYILLLLALVASADIGAYFSGKNFGKHKLAPQVSPGKTWEGFWGGMLGCCIFLLIVNTILTSSIASNIESTNSIVAFSSFKGWLSLLLLGVCMSCLSVIGDLFESMLKRIRGLKDSGTILPGHGGVLDRLDGVIATLPLYVFLLVNFGK